MNDAGALASLKWMETANRLRSFVNQSRFKLLVIGFFSIIFWFCLYRLFYMGLKFVEGIALGGTLQELMAAMFYIFFFALTVMLIFSNGIIGYSSYFKSKETGFLLATPARPEMVFLYKFSESLVFSSWAFLFLGTPLMTAYGHLIGASWDFYVGAAVFLAAFMFIPAALGSIVAMLITVYAPRTRKGLVIGGALAGMIVLMGVVVWLLNLRVSHGVELELAREVFQSIEFSRFPFLPSYWVTKGILTLAEGQYAPAGFFLGVIAANGLFLMSISYVLSGHYMVRGWHISQGLRSGKRYLASGFIDTVFQSLLFFTDRNVRLIVIKDVKSFIRDPVQWSQFLIFFGLLAIYFLNLRAFAYDEKDIFWKNLIAQMNILATSLTLATFASRFIFPQLSLEGRRFWVIGMAPMTREKILFGKLALSFTCSLIISEALITLSSVMLGTPVSSSGQVSVGSTTTISVTR